MTRPQRIAVSGYYGFKNAGDEAVLAGLISAIRQAPGGDSVEITALSIDPESTRAEHKIQSAHRYKIGPLLSTLASTDLLLSGGGSLLQDVTSSHGIFYYLGVVRAAQIMGKKTMFVAQGIGPLNLPRSRKLTAFVANRCDAITVRDPASADLLREIGVTRPEIVVTADPALLLEQPQIERLPQIGYSVRKWSSSADQISTAVQNVFKSTLRDVPINCLLMSPEDVIIAGFPQPGSWRGNGGYLALAKQIASCELIIGMRLHSLILAAANGVPSVALSYDPKVNAFMEMTGQGDMIYDLSDNDPEKLAGMIENAWVNRAARASALLSRLPDLRRAALKNGEIAMGLL